jgi:hypothetical protein
MSAVLKRRQVVRWDDRCSEILQRMAGQHHDHEICAAIAAATGKHFMPRTVAEYRRAGDLPPCRRNNWTAALKTIPRKKAGTAPLGS